MCLAKGTLGGKDSLNKDEGEMYVMLPEEVMALMVGVVVMVAVILIWIFHRPGEKK